MESRRFGGFLGWMLLLVALALPAAMFWKWQQSIREKNMRSIETPDAEVLKGPLKARIFPDSAETEAFVNPISGILTSEGLTGATAKPAFLGASPLTPAATALPAPLPVVRKIDELARELATALKALPAPPPGGLEVSSVSPAAVGVSSGAVPAGVSVTTALPSGQGTALLLAAGPPPPVLLGGREPAPDEGSLKVRFNPETQRDPMISPIEAAKLKAVRAARRKAEKDILDQGRFRGEEERRRMEEEKRKKEEGKKLAVLSEVERRKRLAREKHEAIKKKIQLLGIVAGEEGAAAIINNGTYTVGETVEGARILKITGDSVVFRYKGRRFTKTME